MDWLVWEKVPESSKDEIWCELANFEFPIVLDPLKLKCSNAKLSFYNKYTLLRVDGALPNDLIGNSLFLLWAPELPLLFLYGSNDPIYHANKLENLHLNAESGADYIRFFCFAVRTENGSFTLLEKIPEGYSPENEEIAKLYKPLHFMQEDDKGNFLFKVVMAFGDIVANVTFLLHPNGELKMDDDEPLSLLLPTSAIPILPELGSPKMLNKTYIYDNNRYTYDLDTSTDGLISRQLIDADDPIDVDEMTVRLTLVELLLEQALAKQSRNRLLGYFNEALATKNAIDQFAELMVRVFPIVSVESSIPFVEEVIGQIIKNRAKSISKFDLITTDSNTDELSVYLNLPAQGPAIALISLQSNCRLIKPERVSYELSTKKISAILACDNFSSLPECLRRRVDIKLKLPAINAATFETLFARVIGAPPPSDWRVLGDDWVKYMEPTDFEHPRRMGLKPKTAFDYIHSQIVERIAAIDPELALGLNQLHGLGEARQFAEDLIADIHSAMNGKISWAQVDQGALLVGPPGTGKTTLAKAIAKECGVKFITASAAAWMATGEHLQHHVRAIRETFSEARRYAPSIVFIDEIDSLGNRELFSGPNAQYHTEVVNSVLEQMQGVDPEAPVFILAATNHAERVDAALKRSGRLDRVINIPLPNAESLSKIYEHYLDTFAKEVGLDNSVDPVPLGGLSVGLTGADVVRIVRGAVRIARKQIRALNQNDLIGELTGKSRSVEGTFRMTPAEMERVAWHESGHALACYLGSSQGGNIGFVTIVPRSDGSLGFVANVSDERVSFTHGDYIEQIEIFLAGRAAEEIKFGEEHISSGSSSDLQSASALAIRMVTKLALGKNRKLLWVDQPSHEDLKQAELLLLDTYNAVMLKLTENKQLLSALANELLKKQELTGDKVRGVFSGKSLKEV